MRAVARSAASIEAGAVDFFTSFFAKVDSLGVAAIQSLFQQLATGLSPVFLAWGLIYVIWHGIELVTGRSNLSASGLLWKLARLALIYSIAFTWGDFQSIIVNVLVGTGNDVATAICSAVGASNCGQGDSSVASGLSSIWNAGVKAQIGIAAAGGLTGVGLMILSYIVLFLIGLFLVFAAFLIILGKLAMFVLLALAPLFISMALFGFSSHLFDGWIKTTVQYAILPIIVYGFLAFYILIMQKAISTLGNMPSGTDPDMGLLGTVVIMAGIGTLLLAQAPGIAASIAGGTGLRTSGNSVARLGWGAVSGAAKGVAATARMGFRLGSRGRGSPSSSNTIAGANIVNAGGSSSSASQVSAALQATRT